MSVDSIYFVDKSQAGHKPKKRLEFGSMPPSKKAVVHILTKHVKSKCYQLSDQRFWGEYKIVSARDVTRN